jgi:hypothetical protein
VAALDRGRRSPAWQRLSEEEKRQIAEREAELNEAKRGDEYKQIRTALEALNQASMHLAELMMDSAVTTALKGKNMDRTEMEGGPTAAHPIAPAEITRD